MSSTAAHGGARRVDGAHVASPQPTLKSPSGPAGLQGCSLFPAGAAFLPCVPGLPGAGGRGHFVTAQPGFGRPQRHSTS